MNAVRRSLLKLKPIYTAELVGFLAHYRACTKECVESLLRTPAIQSHVTPQQSRIMRMLASWE